MRPPTGFHSTPSGDASPVKQRPSLEADSRSAVMLSRLTSRSGLEDPRIDLDLGGVGAVGEAILDKRGVLVGAAADRKIGVRSPYCAARAIRQAFAHSATDEPGANNRVSICAGSPSRLGEHEVVAVTRDVARSDPYTERRLIGEAARCNPRAGR